MTYPTELLAVSPKVLTPYGSRAPENAGGLIHRTPKGLDESSPDKAA